jgi:hypothetical protein
VIGVYWIGNIVIGAAEIVLFALIVAMTHGTYRRTRARVTRTLFLFSALMLLYSLLVVSVSVGFSYRYGSGVALPLLGINAVSLVAFLLLYLFISQ